MVKSVVLIFLFLCSVWKFHKTPINLRFICAPNPSSLTDVSKWLSVVYKSILPVVNDVWALMVLEVKSVVLVFRFFMVFGSSIKPWLLWDLFVQLILLLSQISLNHRHQFFLQSYTTCGQMIFGHQSLKRFLSLLLVVEFSMTLKEQWVWQNS